MTLQRESDARSDGRSPSFDVFLSYNSRDRSAVQRLAGRLKRAGLEPWFDRWSTTPGGEWQDEIVAGLRGSSACAVFIGPGDVGAWERLELAVALIRAADDRTFRLFPVLLPGIDSFDPSTLPPFLATRTWVDLRDGVESDRGLRDLRKAVLGLPFGPDVVEPQEGPCPYRGLAVFEEEHARFYFGRENQVQRLVERFRRDRFVAVIGPSGSGKSSLIRAGVLPRIRAGAVPGSADWQVRVLRPGAHPLAALAAQVLSLDPTLGMQSTVDGLSADARTLHMAVTAVLADAPPEARVLLVIDQGEELFTLCRDPAERQAFLDNIHHATVIPGGRTAAVLTLRVDFYSRLARHAAVAQLAQSHQILVGGLTDEELRQAIEEPLRVVGLEVEPGLVETILSDVVREPGSLPLLQHALLETWRRRHGGMLTLAGYRATGGVQRGLADRAETLYGELTPDCRDIARDVFLRLVQPGDGTEDTRRRIGMRELCTRVDGDLVEDVVRRFVAERLLTTSADGDAEQDDRYMEISHEALISGWPRLRGWIEADRAGLRIHRRLTAAAQEWQRLGDDEGTLYRGGRLVEATEWADQAGGRLNTLERRFLAASAAADAAARTARVRRARRALAALAVALTVITAVAVVAIRNGRLAAVQRDIAISRQLAASATGVLTVNPSLSLALALRAYAVAPTDQAEQILRQATAESREVATLRDGPGEVYSARLVDDGRTVISGGDDGAVRVWDVAGRRVTARYPVASAQVTGVARSSDGRYLAASALDGAVTLLAAPRFEPRVAVRPPEGVYATSVDFDADGGRLAASLSDGTVRVVDCATGRQTASLAVGAQPVFHVAFAPKGGTVVAASADGAAYVRDVATGAEVATLRGHESAVLSAVFDRSGATVLTAGADGTVRTWDAASGAPRATIRVDEQAVFAVDVSPDGRRIVTGGEDGFVRIIDVDGIELARMPGHAGVVIGAAFSSTGDRVVSAGQDGSVRLWDPTVDEAVPLATPTAAWSADGRRIVVGGTDGHVRVLDAADLTTRLDLPGAAGRTSPQFSADGRRIVSAAEDGSVRVWEAGTGIEVAALHLHDAQVWAAAFDPRGDRVVSGGQDGVVVSNLLDGSTERLPGQSGAVNSVRFSPDGQLIAAAGADGVIRLWGPDRSPAELTGHEGPVLAVVFSRDGALIASAGSDGTVRIWHRDGTPVAVLRGHEGPVKDVAFDRSGGRLVSGGDDGTVRIWDVTAARLLVALRVHAGPASTVDIAPDGQRMVTVSEEDRVVKVINCEVCGPVASVRDLAAARGGRPLTPEEEQRYLS